MSAARGRSAAPVLAQAVASRSGLRRTGRGLKLTLAVWCLAAGLARAAVVQHDNSAVCVTALPTCESKCKGQDFFFVCSAGGGPQGAPSAVCRCADTAPPVGGGSQGAPAAARAAARLPLLPNPRVPVRAWAAASAVASRPPRLTPSPRALLAPTPQWRAW